MGNKFCHFNFNSLQFTFNYLILNLKRKIVKVNSVYYQNSTHVFARNKAYNRIIVRRYHGKAISLYTQLGNYSFRFRFVNGSVYLFSAEISFVGIKPRLFARSIYTETSRQISRRKTWYNQRVIYEYKLSRIYFVQIKW